MKHALGILALLALGSLPACGSATAPCVTEYVEVMHFVDYVPTRAVLDAKIDAGWTCDSVALLTDALGREIGVRYECVRC